MQKCNKLSGKAELNDYCCGVYFSIAYRVFSSLGRGMWTVENPEYGIQEEQNTPGLWELKD